MGIFLVIIHVLACLILILVILLQAGRGQGLTGTSFTSGNVQGIFGTRAADFLTKATTVAAILFLFTCIGLDIFEAQRSRSLFSAKRPVVPVDVQQIQKVLEKIKAEGANPAQTTPTPEKVKEEKLQPVLPPAPVTPSSETPKKT